MCLYEIHAALRALARRVLNYFRVHRAGVFVCVAAMVVFGFVATRHDQNGSGEERKWSEQRKLFLNFHCWLGIP